MLALGTLNRQRASGVRHAGDSTRPLPPISYLRSPIEMRELPAYSFAQQPASNAAGGADSNQPMLIVALEEQLGLKLESRRTDVPVVVVDSVERPTAD